MYNNYEEYKKTRKEYVNKCKQSVYQGQTFSSDFEKANELFIQMLLDHQKSHPNKWYQMNTLVHKEEIEGSQIYNILKQMPKGCIHHIHGDCCLDYDLFFKEFAYEDTTYFNSQTQEFRYIKDNNPPENFQKLKDLKDQAPNLKDFERSVLNRLHLPTEVVNDQSNNIWQEFDGRIININGFLYQERNYIKYLRRMFENLIADGVRRVEAKMFLGWVIGEDGKALEWEQYHALVIKIVNEMQVKTPDFSFAIIVQGLKMWGNEEQLSYLRKVFEVKKKNPEFVVAYDLVQEEDNHQNLESCAEFLITIGQFEKEFGIEMPLVLHGGESLDSLQNCNIFDNVLLKCKRIGHGLSLIHHSYLLDTIKQQGICIEACPVSNQILRYITDIRMHPLKTFLNYGIKVSINPDDPSFFGYTGVTLDYYYAAVGGLLDLKDLKTLVKNNIDCSLCSEQEKAKMTEQNEKNWGTFIQSLLKKH